VSGWPPAVGERRERVICAELHRTQIVQYAGASCDYSPLHTDEVAAVRAGQPSVMAHGMMVMAASGGVLTDWVGLEALTRFGVRFRAPVWPGDRLVAAVTVTAVDADGSVDFRLSTTNQDGTEVVAGTATARVIEPLEAQGDGA
jgi:acyl dehydratase